MSACLSNSDFSAYEAGKLDPKRKDGVREHLATCEKCRESYEQFRNEAPQTIDSPPSRSLAIDSLFPPAAPVKAEADDVSRHYPKIEGYRILGVLGQGGMGIVYRAVQTKLNRTVALKVLPAMMGAANPSAVSRFRREATAAARLHHTNIIPIHDFGESRDAYYYAMDLIVGQPLNALIKRMSAANAPALSPTRLSEALRAGDAEVMPSGLEGSATGETFDDSGSSFTSSTPSGRGRAYFQHVARWMADAAEALHYAHGQGIIHRDIKPGNLILSVDGRIMVADFGLAKTVDEESVTMTGALLGSLRYVSPEQAMAKRVRVDHRTDIYSLGATMYELLCFQPAFPGSDEKAILGAIIAREPTAPRKILPAVPSELETICLKTLEKSPESRYPTARALAEDLRRYINDLPITAKRPGPVKRVIKFVRRRKAPVIAVTAAVLLAATIGLWFRAEAEGHEKEINGLYQSGMFYGQNKKWVDADEEFQKALLMEPRHVPTLLGLAWINLEQNRLNPSLAGAATLTAAEGYASRAMEFAIGDVENTVKALGFKGVALRRMEKHPEAIVALKTSLELSPDVYHNWSNLGALYVITGDLIQAERCLRQGATLAGDEQDQWHAAAWRNLATFELFQKKGEAAEHIGKALEAYDEDVLAWVIQTRIRLELSEHLDVRKALNDAEYADRKGKYRDPRAKRVLALANLRKGELDDAIPEALAAIEFKDEPTPNHLIIAAVEAKKGNVERARESLKKAESAWPEKLRKPGSYTASAESSELWIESADDLLQLKAEAESAIAAASGSAP